MTVLLLFLLSGCADFGGGIGEPDCFRGLCGCASSQVVNVTIRLTDASANPISNAKLICHDASGLLGTTDADGLIHLSVDGFVTSACGFFAQCEIAYVHKEDGSKGRPFWFTQYVSGNEVQSGEDRIEVINNSQAKTE